MSFNTVGKSFKRVDGIDKVSGSALFIDDIRLPNMLYAKIFRSPVAHGIIKKIDVSKAEKIPGVVKIVTGKEAQKYMIGGCIVDQTPIAVDKVRFVGEPVAAVIAEDADTARLALDYISVDIDELPSYFSAEKAASKDASLIHPNMKKYSIVPTFRPVYGTNIYHHYKLKKGNIAKAFKQADLIVETKTEFPHSHHLQIEPHGSISLWDLNGKLTIWSSAQSPFAVREFLSHCFNIPMNKIEVKIPYIGGGFGGKSDVTIEPLSAYISMFVPNKPVKLLLTREEMFDGTVIGRGAVGYIKTAVKKDGTILGVKIKLYFACGAYGEYAINVVQAAGHNAPGAYNIPNIQSESLAVYTNTPPVGAYRGYGHPEGHFLTERQMDKIAEKLSMNPVALRMKNILKPGDTNALNQIIVKSNGNLKKSINTVVKELNYDISKPHKSNNISDEKSYKFKGIAISPLMKSPVMAANAFSTAIVKFNEDATCNLLISGSDIGQGAYTVLTQICAETLQIPFENVHCVRKLDTDYTPYEWQTVASSTTWKCGNAVKRAAENAIEIILKNATYYFNTNINKIEYSNGRVYLKSNRRKNIPLQKVCQGFQFNDGHTKGEPVVGYGSFVPNITYPSKKTGQGNCASEWTFGAQGAEVEIDIRTGEIKVLKFITALDAGKVINPQLAKGQIEGGVVQALGAVLSEKLIYSIKGSIRNKTLTDYKIPTLTDVFDTELITIFLETPQHDGPYGARCIAEHPVVSVAPVIVNAIKNATGLDFYKLPVLAEDIVLHDKLYEN